MKRALVLAVILLFISSGLCFAKVVKQYFPNKKIKSIQSYNKKGQLDGPTKIYWLNGKLREKRYYKNGVIKGHIKRYSVTGVLLGA